MANGLGIATEPQQLIQQQQPGGQSPDLRQLLSLQQPREPAPVQAVPEAPQQTTPPESRPRPLIPNFRDDPLASLGLLLRNVAAGYQGRELPTDILLKQQREEELQGIAARMDKSKHFMNVLDKGLELSKNINDPEQRDRVIDAFSANFPMFPDVAGRLKEISSGQEGALKFEVLKKTLPALNLLAQGDDQLFNELLNNEKLFEAALGANARNKRGFLTNKIPEIIQFAKQTGARMDSVDDIFAINDSLPEPLGPLELDALSRQSGIAARFGLATQDQAEKGEGGRSVTTVISGSSSLGKQLGIPPGERARVKQTRRTDGGTSAEVLGRFGGASQVIQILPSKEETAFQIKKGEGAGKLATEFIDRGFNAVATEQNLNQMAGLLSEISRASSTEGIVQTGAAQPLITSIQALAADFGVDIDKAANAVGINNVGNLSKKEDFDRLSQKLVIEAVDTFKGNLNETEIQTIKSSVASMGRSEQANITAVAAGLAGATIAKERGIEATKAKTTTEMNALSRRLLAGDTKRFKELQEKFRKQIEGQVRSTSTEPSNKLPEGSKLVGHTKESGLPIFKTPDGRFVVDE